MIIKKLPFLYLLQQQSINGHQLMYNTRGATMNYTQYMHAWLIAEKERLEQNTKKSIFLADLINTESPLALQVESSVKFEINTNQNRKLLS